VLPNFRKQFHPSRKITTAFHAKHVGCKNKPIAFLKCKCEEMKHSETNLASVIKGENGNVCKASYKVSYHIAICGETHMIAENIIIPCVEDIVSCVLGDNHLKVIKNVPLSCSTVSRGIEDEL
jgi:hypothetical protein